MTLDMIEHLSKVGWEHIRTGKEEDSQILSDVIFFSVVLLSLLVCVLFLLPTFIKMKQLHLYE